MGLKDHVNTRPGIVPGTRLDEVLADLPKQDRADLLDLLTDPAISSGAIQRAMRIEFPDFKLGATAVKKWRAAKHPELFS